jgi:hypothetical protein
MRPVSNAKRNVAIRSAQIADNTMLPTLLALITLAVLFVIVVNPVRVLSQGVALVRVDVEMVSKGYRMSKLINSGVVNDKNEKIGTLDDVIVDNGRNLFAVLQVGGFLGLGGKLVALPFESLKIDDEGRKIELPGATKDELKKAADFHYRT